MSTMIVSDTRSDRAEQLREAVQALVDRSSLRQAEGAIGISVGAIRSLLAGGTPRGETMRKLDGWARRVGIDPPPPARPVSRPRWRTKAEIGQTIQRIRKDLELNQDELAERIGRPGGQPDVSRWENGHARPEYETLEAIARLAGTDVRIFQIPEGEAPPQTLHEPAATYTPGTFLGVLEREAGAAERRLANAERYARAAEIEAEAARERAQAAKEWALYTRIAEENARDLRRQISESDRDRETAEMLMGERDEHGPRVRNRGKAPT